MQRVTLMHVSSKEVETEAFYRLDVRGFGKLGCIYIPEGHRKYRDDTFTLRSFKVDKERGVLLHRLPRCAACSMHLGTCQKCKAMHQMPVEWWDDQETWTALGIPHHTEPGSGIDISPATNRDHAATGIGFTMKQALYLFGFVMVFTVVKIISGNGGNFEPNWFTALGLGLVAYYILGDLVVQATPPKRD